MDQTRIIIKGLPKFYSDKDLAKQFSEAGEITDCKIQRTVKGKSRGFAFIGYKQHSEAVKAVNDFNNTFINTSKIFVELAKPIGDESLEECYSRKHKNPKDAKEQPEATETKDEKDKTQKARPDLETDPDYIEFLNARRARNVKPSWNEGVVEYIEKVKEEEENHKTDNKKKKTDNNDNDNDDDNNESEPKKEKKKSKIDSTRIMIKNIPYDATENDIEGYFSQFGELTEAQVPFDKQVQRNKGFAFVSFTTSESVIQCLEKSHIFQGRHLKLQPADPAPKKPEDVIPDDDESYASKKKRQMKVEKPESWNALFLNKDTVAEATAKMLGFTKSQIMNPESDDIASRLAIAESQLINETKAMFENAGIDLSLFTNPENIRLSRTLLIAKNLKYESTEEEIRNMFAAYGSLIRFIFPPTHAIALVEFARPEDAKKAYQGLSFKKVHDVPMMLQWAPSPSTSTSKVRTNDSNSNNSNDNDNDEGRSKKAKDSNKQLKTTTLIMKNVPFKATRRELYDLVNVYAKVKAVRMPKKADGSGHRGFVFLDFNSRQEATAALDNLGNVHLYDRHLVVQPADVGRNVDALVKAEEK